VPRVGKQRATPSTRSAKMLAKRAKEPYQIKKSPNKEKGALTKSKRALLILLHQQDAAERARQGNAEQHDAG